MKFTPRAALAALVSALVITFITIDVNGIAFFLGYQMKSAILFQIFGPFLTSYLILLVLTFVAAFLGWMRNRWISLAVGVVASLVSGVVGIWFNIASQAAGATPDQVIEYIFTMTVIFVSAATVATLTAGVAVYRRMSSGGRGLAGQVALVRAPAANLAEGLVTHVRRKKVDVELANTQWDAYVETLNSCGWNTVEVEPSENLADSVFVEDTVVMLGDTAVITSPGATEREAEIIATETAVRALGVKVARIEKPGTLDGGDVLKIGKTVYIGSGGRTNGEGIRQFRAIAAKLGYTVVAVPVTKALHLKSAVTALPDGTVIGYPPLVDNTALFPRFQPVPEAHGTAVVVLASDLLLMSAAAPKTAKLLESLGYNIVTVDISEFEKLEGCVTCLSVRVR